LWCNIWPGEIPGKENEYVTVTPSQTKGGNPLLFVGTYTEPDGSRSEGIYVYHMDSSSGKLTFENVVKGILNPSYLEIHPGLDTLYTVNEVQNFSGQRGGGVSAFSINHQIRELTLLNSQSSQGEDPCYISIERTGRYALVANYSSGSVAMLPIQDDGQLGKAADVVQHSGSSVHSERQKGPYAHCIVPDPPNRFALAVDLGTDKIFIYRMDLDKGKLYNHAEVQVEAGSGPRHLTFHPDLPYAYLVNELNSTLTVYRYHSEAGALEELQTVQTLPEDFNGENLAADIHIAPSGNYLYASNRGHDSIVCFRIDKSTGLLSYGGHTPTHGHEPRNFAIDPGGKFLLAANQKSANIVTFEIDATTGRLSTTGYEQEVSMPVCLKFLIIHRWSSSPEWK
jgi:6-phosphogluconolactonase